MKKDTGDNITLRVNGKTFTVGKSVNTNIDNSFSLMAFRCVYSREKKYTSIIVSGQSDLSSVYVSL